MFMMQDRNEEFQGVLPSLPRSSLSLSSPCLPFCPLSQLWVPVLQTGPVQSPQQRFILVHLDFRAKRTRLMAVQMSFYFCWTKSENWSKMYFLCAYRYYLLDFV